MTDMSTAVRVGLARLVHDWPEWSTHPLVLLKNRLLDECGGDARPYIALVIRAAEVGVPDRIVEWGGVGGAWSSVRGPLIVSLISESFLRQEMATWVVDTWGAALLGGERLGIKESSPPLSFAPPIGATAAPPRSPPPPRPGSNSSAGLGSGRTAPRLATAPRGAGSPGMAPSLGATSSSRPAPALHVGPAPIPQRWLRGGIAVIVTGVFLLLYLISQRARDHQTARVEDRGADSTPVPLAPTARRLDAGTASAIPDSTSSALTGLSRAVLPASANDSSSVIVVRPPTRARGTVGPGASVLENSVAMLQQSAPDRVELRSGRVLTGRVEVVRAGTILFRDLESGLRYEVPKSDVQEITTEFGTKVRFNDAGDPTNVRRSPLVMNGLAGVYVVRYEMMGVRGSRECQRDQRPISHADVMDIRHSAGADTLVMSIRGGATWNAVVDNDGMFTTVFAIQPDQAQSSSAFTSRMSGRFTTRGFDGEVNLLSYRRLRSGPDLACQTTLRAIGERDASHVSTR